jgi:hypothetical protein
MLPDCPICKSTKSVRQSHKRRLDHLWRFFGCYAYRCDGCSTRFFRFFKPKDDESSAG